MALGEWNVDRMAETMPLSLFREWLAYARQAGGIGQARHDWNAAMAAATVANAIIATHTRSRRRLKIHDLMYRPAGRDEGSSGLTDPRAIYAAIRMAAIVAMGAKDPKAVAN